MIEKYNHPPYQPKWALQLQVFLLRHLKTSFNNQFVIITTTGRKTGQRRSVPIGLIPDGDSYLAMNIGGHSNWYLNALANPCVTLEIGAKKFEARVEKVPVDSPQALRRVMDVISREKPQVYKSFFGASGDSLTNNDLLKICGRASFLRFTPLA
jgi:deazaflavin-dependent oxidoreductase (nitroreductase family)